MNSKVGLFLFLGLVTVFSVILLTAPWGDRILNAAGTVAGTPFTNTATLEWTGGTITQKVVTTVATNYGATWVGENNKTITPNNTASNITYFTNDGNMALTFEIYYTEPTNSRSNTWVAWYTNITDGGNSNTTLSVNISSGGWKEIHLKVYVPASETNGSFGEYRGIATNTLAVSANAARYTGYNGIVYGGNMGINGAGVGEVWLFNPTAGTNWRLTVSAAVMSLTKSVSIVNPAPYAAVTLPVPGAAVIYKMIVSNTGSAQADSVFVKDTVPTVLTYSNNSLRHGAPGDAYAAAAGLTDAAGDDEGAFTAATSNVTFTPNTNNAPTDGGTVPAGTNMAYFYIANLL